MDQSWAKNPAWDAVGSARIEPPEASSGRVEAAGGQWPAAASSDGALPSGRESTTRSGR
ncbi:MAG: hypothetical protein R3B89_27255 [Polyangiaceae bacterium]